MTAFGSFAEYQDDFHLINAFGCLELPKPSQKPCPTEIQIDRTLQPCLEVRHAVFRGQNIVKLVERGVKGSCTCPWSQTSPPDIISQRGRELYSSIRPVARLIQATSL